MRSIWRGLVEKNYPAVLAGLFGLFAGGLLCRLLGFKAGFTSGKFKLGAV
jgi:hypothetical protein